MKFVLSQRCVWPVGGCAPRPPPQPLAEEKKKRLAATERPSLPALSLERAA